ncbi:MAG: hypothetical protein M0011_00645 [Elusimicrobia bacterium]|nr:hypothetical protein [Elusimicrobiota bacterium]
MTLEEFRHAALLNFTRDIVDQFFLYIENDRELMREYLSVLGRELGADETNEYLEQGLRKYFNLCEQGENHSPKTRLLPSFTEYATAGELGVPPPDNR